MFVIEVEGTSRAQPRQIKIHRSLMIVRARTRTEREREQNSIPPLFTSVACRQRQAPPPVCSQRLNGPVRYMHILMKGVSIRGCALAQQRLWWWLEGRLTDIHSKTLIWRDGPRAWTGERETVTERRGVRPCLLVWLQRYSIALKVCQADEAFRRGLYGCVYKVGVYTLLI